MKTNKVLYLLLLCDLKIKAISENRIMQPKNYLHVQQDSNSEPLILVLDTDTLLTVPLKCFSGTVRGVQRLILKVRSSNPAGHKKNFLVG